MKAKVPAQIDWAENCPIQALQRKLLNCQLWPIKVMFSNVTCDGFWLVIHGRSIPLTGKINSVVLLASRRNGVLCIKPSRCLKVELSSGLLITAVKPETECYPQRIRIKKMTGREKLVWYDTELGISLPREESKWIAFWNAILTGQNFTDGCTLWTVIESNGLIIGGGEFLFAFTMRELLAIREVVDKFSEIEFK